jgi:transcriptional regulator with XRE-family HTH domain
MFVSRGYRILRRMRIPQKHVSECTGIMQPRICRILKNQDNPTPEELEKLCHFFDLTEEELFSQEFKV